MKGIVECLAWFCSTVGAALSCRNRSAYVPFDNGVVNIEESFGGVNQIRLFASDSFANAVYHLQQLVLNKNESDVPVYNEGNNKVILTAMREAVRVGKYTNRNLIQHYSYVYEEYSRLINDSNLNQYIQENLEIFGEFMQQSRGLCCC